MNSGHSCVWSGSRAPGSSRTICISKPPVTATSLTNTPAAKVDGTRATAVWYMRNNELVSHTAGPTLPGGWSLAGAADFNGDGYPDYLLLNASTGQTVIWYMNGTNHITGRHGPVITAGYEFLGAADFDRNGRPDYVLYNPSTHQTAIWYMDDNLVIGSASGPNVPGGWSLVAP
jgi:FG-GAP-like repeat